MPALLLAALCSIMGAPHVAVPLPTQPQLAWQKNEIMALVHFNMATFFHNGDPGCNAANWNESQHPASFAPNQLNVSNWIVSMKALGVKEAVLTAKHDAGSSSGQQRQSCQTVHLTLTTYQWGSTCCNSSVMRCRRQT